MRQLVSFLFLLPTLLVYSSVLAGVNSENYQQNLDFLSPIMWETARPLPPSAFLWAYTLSYAYRPVEFGDGQKRYEVSDHLQTNHFGLAYGINSKFSLGLNLPIALYSRPNNQKYIQQTDLTRSLFFLNDMSGHVKWGLVDPEDQKNFQLAWALGLTLPTGSSQAMLSDESVKITLTLPMTFRLMAIQSELFLTPGISFWSDGIRLVARDNQTLLYRKQGLLLNAGGRYWLNKRSLKTGRGSLLEGGIRSFFSEFSPSFKDKASPVEWSVGGALYLNPALSIHGALGSGLSAGVGAPALRLLGGVRYLSVKLEPKKVAKKTVGESTSAYSDQELDRIFQEAAKDPQPSRKDDEQGSELQLLTDQKVISLGAVRFEFNSAQLTPEAQQVVALLYEHLQRLKPRSIKIDGHTDSVGSFNYNLMLSKKRAESVKEELGRLGQDISIVKTEGFSFKYPVESNASMEGRAKNRRIEVSLNGKSFRKSNYSEAETRQFQEWIYPGGKQPKSNEDNP